jgi:hypothetical protein
MCNYPIAQNLYIRDTVYLAKPLNFQTVCLMYMRITHLIAHFGGTIPLIMSYVSAIAATTLWCNNLWCNK